MSNHPFTHLDALESEAIHIMREVAAECAHPALLFSGGKDSVVLLRLAEKAFRPGRFPFPLVHIDTEHNFPEVIEFRDRRAEQLGERLIVSSMEDSIKKGRVVLRSPTQSRNAFQSVKNLNLMPVSVVHVAMKKKRALRSGFSPFEMNSGNGIRRINGRNYGTFTTRERILVKIFVCFQSVIGLSWMSGSPLIASGWRCLRYTLHIYARSFGVMPGCCRSPIWCNREKMKSRKKSWCVSVPLVT